MTITAKYRSVCAVCKRRILKGDVIEWARGLPPRHTDCHRPLSTRSILTVFASGAEHLVNSRGRCEDAPCCGCCS